MDRVKDYNLHEELELLDFLYDDLRIGTQVALYDPDTGAEFDQLVVSDFEIAPMVQTMNRNYRTCSMELLRTSNALS